MRYLVLIVDLLVYYVVAIHKWSELNKYWRVMKRFEFLIETDVVYKNKQVFIIVLVHIKLTEVINVKRQFQLVERSAKY